MIEVKYIGDALSQRIERAVEQVKDRLRRVTQAISLSFRPMSDCGSGVSRARPRPLKVRDVPTKLGDNSTAINPNAIRRLEVTHRHQPRIRSHMPGLADC
jgi:hypothetical protein